MKHACTVTACLAVSALGCAPDAGGAGGAGGGALRVLLEAEDTISSGLVPGSGPEDIQDGWSVRFERYLVAIGDIRVSAATNSEERRRAARRYVVDLTQLSEAGLPLWEVPSLDVGRFTFGYALGQSAELTRHSSVERASFDDFVAQGSTYRLRGHLEKPDGVSCPPPSLAEPSELVPRGSNGGGAPCYENQSIAFDLSFVVPALVGPCERDGSEGFAISDGRTTTVSITIHGDHVFFNGFPEGTEGGVMRLAQWLADCDLNVDGELTTEELRAIAPADLFELDLGRFQFGGSPILPLSDLVEYLRAQLSTQGHFQGEGECAIGFP